MTGSRLAPPLFALLLAACGTGTLGTDVVPEASGEVAADAVVPDGAVDTARPEADAARPDTAADEAGPPPTTCDQTAKTPSSGDAFVQARGVTTDGTYIFVTDSANGAVLKFTDTLTLAGRWEGFDGPVPTGEFQPYGIAVGNDRIFVTDLNNGHGRVLEATGSGYFERAWGDGADGGPVLKVPKGIALANDEVYVADAGNGSVYAYSTIGTLLRTVSDGGLGEPVALAVKDDRLLVADKAAGVVVVLSTGGDELGRYDFDGLLEAPEGVAVDAERVFVADSATNRLVKGSAAGTLLSWCGGSGGGSGELNRPQGLVVLGAQVFLADNGNKRLLKIHP